MLFASHIELLLKKYVSLLLKWNKSINLISKSTESDIWERHILDSAQLFSYTSVDDHIYDLGSGAGFPGIVLSIMGSKNITLVESDTRKCAFLRQAALLSQNKIEIINERIENCLSLQSLSEIDLITSRALDNINNLLHYNRIFTPTKGFLLLKGKNFQKELAEAEENWHFDYSCTMSITNPEAVILEIRNVHKKT